MADLSGSTIASTYDRLLALPSGGLNGTNLVALTDGNASATCALSVATTSIAISATDKFYLDDGGNTYIYESAADIMDFYSGGTHMLSLDNINTEVVINEGSADINFRVEGNGLPSLIFCDAGNDRVGIGTSIPDDTLHVAASDADVTVTISGDATSPAVQGLQLWHDFSHGDVYIDSMYDHADNDMFFRTRTAGTPITAMTIRGSGYVGVGTTAPGTWFEVAAATHSYLKINCDRDGAGTSTSALLFSEAGSQLWAVQMNGGTANQMQVYDYGDSSVASHIATTDNDWQAGSDLRIKKDINNIDSVLDNINSLRPITWKRKYGTTDRVYPGLVAQEVLPHFPLVVSGTEDSFKEIPAKDAVEAKAEVLDGDGNVIEEAIEAQEATSLTYGGGLSIGYSNFVPYLVKAIQELSAKVTALENA